MATLDVTRVNFSHHLVSVAIRLKDRELHFLIMVSGTQHAGSER